MTAGESAAASVTRSYGRSLEDFFDTDLRKTDHGLYDGEERLLVAAKNGKPCKLGDEPCGTPEAKTEQNFVRASFVRFLALGGDADHPVHEKGVQLECAWIGDDIGGGEGDLDLANCKSVLPLFLTYCKFAGNIVLTDAHTRTIDLEGSVVEEGIEARGAFIEGTLYLRSLSDPEARKGFQAKGGMNLVDATIKGSLECHNAKFGVRRNKYGSEEGTAIFASRAKIAGSVFLQRTFSADGPTVFRDANIGGNFECSGGEFAKIGGRTADTAAGDSARARRAIDCQGAKIGGGVIFRQTTKEDKNFIAEGEICFIDTVIGGSFECHGAVMNNPGGDALICSRMDVTGSVFMHKGFRAEGQVSFRRATIGGHFECSGGTFNGNAPDSGEPKVFRAIDCHGAKIGGSVYLKRPQNERSGNAFRAKGEVRFIDAEVAGSFECHGAVIKNRGADALGCSRIKVGGSVLMIDNFLTKGRVSFRRADVGGNFDASCGTFLNMGSQALACESIHVIGHVLLGLQSKSSHTVAEGTAGSEASATVSGSHEDGSRNSCTRFIAKGKVDFSGAQIEGDFECLGGNFSGDTSATGNPRDRVAIDCQGAKVGGSVKLREYEELYRPGGKIPPIEKAFEATGEVRFIDATVGGSFECHGARIRNPEADALGCSRIEVGGSVLLIDAFSSQGEVKFSRADVGGNFDASNGTFVNRGGAALSCDNIHVTGDVLLGLKSDSSRSRRKIGANSTETTGASASDSSVDRENGGEKKKAHFKAEGEVDFAGARIEGDFDGEGGHFINPKRRSKTGEKSRECANALKLRRADIGGALRLGENAHSFHPVIWGGLDLRGAKVSDLIDAEKSWPRQTVSAECFPTADEIDKAYKKPRFIQQLYRQLRSFRIPSFSGKHPEKELSCYIYMDGFTYGHFGGGSPLDARLRRNWLLRQPKDNIYRNLKPQPFEQLIKVLRAMGHSQNATRIAVTRESLTGIETILSIPVLANVEAINYIYSRIWRYLWWRPVIGWMFGYGYLWNRALYVAIVYWLICGAFYDGLNEAKYISLNPTSMTTEMFAICTKNYDGNDKTEHKDQRYTDSVQRGCPEFNALKFSAEAMLPLIGLGERRYWVFNAPHDKRRVPIRLRNFELLKVIPEDISNFKILTFESISTSRVDLFYSIERIFGWLLGISLTIVLSQKINRE